ncbi:MAG TPA: (2Fe-2S)-binding protein, partial [Telmatospirillum sp.]|nr:(2Fe-2S)-binding protein [Telmatospirillum sp.]
IDDWPGWTRQHLGDGVWLDYQDRRIGRYRAALIRNDRLEAVLFVAAPGQRPAIEGLAPLFSAPVPEPHRRTELLAGSPLAGRDGGPIVCACHQIGRETILNAIVGQGLASVEAIGQALRAGTNCGSCIPELRGLLTERKR